MRMTTEKMGMAREYLPSIIKFLLGTRKIKLGFGFILYMANNPISSQYFWTTR
jgi:hypothetical protein